MQKVVGSSPIIRLSEPPANAGFRKEGPRVTRPSLRMTGRHVCRPDVVEQRRDVIHVDRPSFGLPRRAPTEPAAVDKDDLVLIGQRTLVWECLEAPAEAAVDEERRNAVAPNVHVKLVHDLDPNHREARLSDAMQGMQFSQSESGRPVRSLSARLLVGMRKVSGCGGTRIRDLRCDRSDETLRLQRLRVTPILWASSVTDLAGNRTPAGKGRGRDR